MYPFFSGFSLMMALIVAIGAQNAFVLRQGLLRQHVGVVIFICWLCDCLLSSAGVFGLSRLFADHPTASRLLALAGGLFLLGYAAKSARRAWLGGGHLEASQPDAPAMSAGKAAATTLALTLLNPHVYIDTVMLIGGAATHFDYSGKWQYLIGAMLASGLWFSLLGYGARLLLPLFKREQVWQLLDSLIALMMLYLSVMLLCQAWSTGV